MSLLIGERQRSREGVVRRNCRPNGCFWRVRFSSALLRFSGVSRANLKGAEKKTDSPKAPFWTTVSVHKRLLRSFGAPASKNVGPHLA